MARTLGNEAIGNIVKVEENGAQVEFIVLKHGYPSAGNGRTLLLRKNVHSKRVWNTETYGNEATYQTCEIASWLDSDYCIQIAQNIRDKITAVPVPIRSGDGGSTKPLITSVRKIFLLSRAEIFTESRPYASDGEMLTYFTNFDNFMALYDSDCMRWWTRTRTISGASSACYIRNPPGPITTAFNGLFGVRPAFTLPSDIFVSDNNEITTNQSPSTPVSIDVPSGIKGGGAALISWNAASDPDGNLAGYRLERSVNGGAYAQIYQGNALSYTDSITYGWGTVAYRVRAYDSVGAVSGYATSPTRNIFNNSAPTAPPSIAVPPEIKGGKAHTVSWGAATDVDGNLSGYQLERSINGAAFAEIYKGPNRTATDTVAKGNSTVTYRVRAYDAENAWSPYATGASQTVINNTPPSISGVDSNLGTKNEAFSVAYSASDPDGDAITITEKLDDKVLRTFTATANKEYQLTLDATAFQKVLNGSHKFTVTATDAPGESVTRIWTWAKNITHVSATMKAPIETAARPYKCLIHVNAAIPTGALLVVEVCNNAKDASPVWEECTEQARGGQVIFITNQNKTSSKWAFNFRVRLNRSGASGDCYITGISGNFEEEGQ